MGRRIAVSSLLRRGPGSLVLEAGVHGRALHGRRAFDGALVVHLERLAARVTLEAELNGIPPPPCP